MRTLKSSSLLVVATMLTSCAAQPSLSTGAFEPHFIGNVNSISSSDKRAILAFERTGIQKEFHAIPESITVRVINHNHVMVFYDVRGQQCGEPVDRIQGKWKGPGGPRVMVSGSNQSLQPTASRRNISLCMIKTIKPAVTLGAAHRG